MSRTKIDYGIDLGTTNSAISRMEQGEAVIKKTDTLADTLPSCVNFNRKKVVRVGESALTALKKERRDAMHRMDSLDVNTFSEFKRTMGSDKGYYSSHLTKDFSSEELSAEVLKTLKSFITDEQIGAIVITVPAKFTINQKDATLRAAIEHAGFNQCELLQEPIAASMAYGLSEDSEDGYWLVFDFGGGTFDAALIKVEDQIMKVIDTEGDNYLGGKTLDEAIVDEIIFPYISERFNLNSILGDDYKKSVFRDGLKEYAEEAKVQLSFKDSHNILTDLEVFPKDDDGDDIELDITLTRDMVGSTIRPIFQKSIDICKDLLERNGLNGKSLNTLLLVGGPTHSSILREMLTEQITKPNVSVDPMTVVSRGAALFASTVSISDDVREKTRDNTKIQLDFGYETTSVEDEEFVTVKMLKEKMTGEIPESVYIEIVRGDEGWSSGKLEVDGIGDVVEVKLMEGKPNAFKVLAYDDKGNLQASEPSEFTIIQGAKVGSATLPFFIGIEIKSKASGRLVFKSIDGLEKNKITPTIGKAYELTTQKQVRPGLKDDFIKIPLYQGPYGANGTPAINNEHIYDVIISGEDLPRMLPAGSNLELTVRVDRSERMTLSVYFPALDHTEEIVVPNTTTQKEIGANWLESEIKKARNAIVIVRQEDIVEDKDKISEIEAELDKVKRHFDQNRNDYDRKKDVLESLKPVLNKIDELQMSSEWPKVEQELKEVFYRLEEACEEFNNQNGKALLSQFKTQMPVVIREKDVSLAQDLISSMRSLNLAILDEGLGAQMEVGYLNSFNDEFETLDWLDRERARMVLNQGLRLAVNSPVKEELRPIVIELFRLLSEADKTIVIGDGNELIG